MDLLIQILKFSIVGILNTAVDFGTLNFLISFSFFRKKFLIANTISVSLAIINSYLWNKYWTFPLSSQKLAVIAQFPLFVLISLIGLLIQNGVLFFLTNFFLRKKTRLYFNFGKLIAVLVAMSWNFLAYKFLVFS